MTPADMAVSCCREACSLSYYALFCDWSLDMIDDLVAVIRCVDAFHLFWRRTSTRAIFFMEELVDWIVLLMLFYWYHTYLHKIITPSIWEVLFLLIIVVRLLWTWFASYSVGHNLLPREPECFALEIVWIIYWWIIAFLKIIYLKKGSLNLFEQLTSDEESKQGMKKSWIIQSRKEAIKPKLLKFTLRENYIIIFSCNLLSTPGLKLNLKDKYTQDFWLTEIIHHKILEFTPFFQRLFNIF